MKDIYIKNDKYFYKKIKKYINYDGIIHLIYNDYDITNDNNIDKYLEIKDKVEVINALNIKDLKERYSYIYDKVCDQLDNDFINNNKCDFVNDKCISVRCNSHCKDSLNGCCYGSKRGLCKNYKHGKCSIKSISCKLFTCRYLKKHGIKYSINDFVLLKYFFNIRQKFIIDTSIFKDKEYIINLLLKNK